MLRLSQFLCAVLIGLMIAATGCSLYRNDRCYVPPQQYQIARDLFIKSGSLDLLRHQLEEYQWRRCRINEAIYRLEKEFEVLPEVVPNPDEDIKVAPSADGQTK